MSSGEACPVVEYVKDDFMENSSQWVDNAAVVFANATCFEPWMLDKVTMLMRE